MSGGQQLGTDLSRRNQQLIELQMVIAQAARDRCAPGKILCDKGTHHVVLETLLLVYDVIRNAKRFGHAARVVNVVDGATTPLHRLRHALVTRQAALVPELQRESDDGVALLTEQRGDGGGVDSSGHCHGDGLLVIQQSNSSLLMG